MAVDSKHYVNVAGSQRNGCTRIFLWDVGELLWMLKRFTTVSLRWRRYVTHCYFIMRPSYWPHYALCSSVCPSVCPVRTPNLTSKTLIKTKLAWTCHNVYITVCRFSV